MIERTNPDGFEANTRCAVEDVCAWPNLKKLPDGSILAAIFNQPCHGMWEGDLDGYRTTDGGETWSRLARIAEHERPGSNRMNCSVGYAANGDLITLCAGWHNRHPRGKSGPFKSEDRGSTRTYRSTDNGKSWTAGEQLPDLPDEAIFTPFGDIHIAADGRLITPGYMSTTQVNRQHGSYTQESTDDGETWQVGSSINQIGNETALLPLGNGRWLAASREEHDKHVEQFVSDDDAKTWTRVGPLTLPGQITAHLLRLHDGRILLSYGNRCINNYGVDVRFSEDDGKSWGEPTRVADAPLRDCGYPSTVELSDGWFLTAWYSQLPGEYQYAMYATRWCLRQ